MLARRTARHPEPPRRGLALVTMMIVAALVTAVVVQMMQRHDLAIRKTSQLVLREQAWTHADAAEAWARRMLVADIREKETEGLVDSLDEPWAETTEPWEIDAGYVRVTIIDLQARINVNNLDLAPLNEGEDADTSNPDDPASPGARGRPTEGLGERTDIPVEQGDPTAPARRNEYDQFFGALLNELAINDDLTSAITDWIDSDEDVSPPWGGEDSEYLLEELQRRTANQPMAELSELLAVRGMDVETFVLLAPHLVALPEPTLVNINTAGAMVLRALGGDAISLGEAEAAVSGDRSAESPGAFFEEFLPSMLGREYLFTVNSSYFEAQIECQFHGQTVWLRSMLHRDPTSGKVTVLSRRRGRAESWPFATPAA